MNWRQNRVPQQIACPAGPGGDGPAGVPPALRARARGLACLFLLLFAGLVEAREFVITFGGDVNFARSRTSPAPDTVTKFRRMTLPEATGHLHAYWAQGDLNFINVETVVADQNGAMQGKTFVFRSHPAQIRYLMRRGVNAFALANNHAWDHGQPGLDATRAFFETEVAPRGGIFAGTGTQAQAFEPHVAKVAGVRVALSSMSFGGGGFQPRADRIGMASLGNPVHVDAVLAGMAGAEADIKILSLHWGAENRIELEGGQRALVQRAYDAGVHLVLGHHPHVVRAVEADAGQGRAAFYSLGNLFFIGGANKDGDGLGRDYGLLGMAYFQMGKDGPRLSALRAVPLKGVHDQPRAMSADRTAATLERLNRLSRRGAGAAAVEFTPDPARPTEGMACFAPPFGPQARAMCCQASSDPWCDLPQLM